MNSIITHVPSWGKILIKWISSIIEIFQWLFKLNERWNVVFVVHSVFNCFKRWYNFLYQFNHIHNFKLHLLALTVIFFGYRNYIVTDCLYKIWNVNDPTIWSNFSSFFAQCISEHSFHDSLIQYSLSKW